MSLPEAAPKRRGRRGRRKGRSGALQKTAVRPDLLGPYLAIKGRYEAGEMTHTEFETACEKLSRKPPQSIETHTQTRP